MADNQNTAKQPGRNPSDTDTHRKGEDANAGAQDRNRQGQNPQAAGQNQGQNQGATAGKPGQATKTTGGNVQASREQLDDKGSGQTAKGSGREKATGSAEIDESDEGEDSNVVVKPMNKTGATGSANSGNR